MNILFLHISDLHLRKNTIISEDKIAGLAKALRKYRDVDEIFVICTGDLASKGMKEEYSKVRYFFGKLNAALKKVFVDKYIRLYIVPGNHDIQIEQNFDPNSDEINDYSWNQELGKMNDYFEYLKDNRAISNKNKDKFDVVSDILRVRNDHSIAINQINTAPFSTLKHNDKEHHFVKYESINKIDNSSELNITMMHHSYDWFHESVKTVLENKIGETDILFYGHEHEVKTGVFNYSNNSLVMLRAGAFDPDDYYNNSYFNVVVYSADEKIINVDEYSWNKNEKLFVPVRQIENYKISKNNIIKYDSDFIRNLFSDEKTNIGLQLFDYFVFPELRTESEDKRIHNNQEFKKIIYSNRVISISGKCETGRTTLLKYIYNDIRNEKFALFINPSDMNNSNIKRIIKRAINDQINEQNGIEKYLQLPKADKIIFIDDFDRIDNANLREQLIKYLSEIFGQVVITVSTDSVSSLKEKFKESFEFDIKNISISALTIKQRKELIGKISSEKGIIIDSNYADEIDKNFKSIPALRFLGNTFIVNYVNLVLSNGCIVSNEGKSNFDILFEQTLRKAIIDNSNKADVDAYFKILELLCYHIHFNKQNQISLSSIDDLIKKYNREYEKSVGTQKFINSMMNARIFVEITNDSYMLTNKMYLSYFVAKAIWSKIINEESYDDFNSVLKNVCFGINGDILMFIIYITQSFKLLDNIYDMCENISKDWDELSFDSKNISFIYNTLNTPKKISNISNEDIAKYEQKKVDNEVFDLETCNITCDGIYDYSEEDAFEDINRINSVFKYVELMSRGIRSFNASMKAEQKYLLIDGVYKNTNKFLYKILSEFNDGIDEFVDYICDGRPMENKVKVKQNLINFLLMFTLSIYDHNLSLCTCNETYKSIDNYIKKSNESSIDVQFLKLVYLDNSGRYGEFINCLKNLLQSTTDPCILTMVRMLVFRKTYTIHMSIKERNSLIDIYNNYVGSSYKISKKNVNIALMLESK